MTIDEKNPLQNYAFFSLHVLYTLRLPDLYFWLKFCVLYSNFYGNYVAYNSFINFNFLHL